MQFDEQKIQRFLDRLLGSEGDLSLNNRAFNGVTLATGIAVFLIFLSDFQINLEVQVYLITFALSLVQFSFYWLGRKGYHWKPLVWALFVIDVSMIAYAWAEFEGLIGLSSVLTVAILAVLPMLFKQIELLISYLLTILTLAVLFALEYQTPRPVVDYPDVQTMLTDYFLTIVSLSSLMFFLVWMVTKSNQLQQTRIESLNKELEAGYAELSQKNEELTRAVHERTASLEANQLLMREMNHRVKNNLTIIRSLLSLEADRFAGSESQRAFQQSSMRIQAISSIHDMLTNMESLKNIPVSTYFTKLMAEIRTNFENPELPVTLKLDVENINMDLDRFLPLALISNELVSNAYKYAFAGRQKGQIWIRLGEKAGTVQLTVSDDGLGIPAGFSLNDTHTLGMRIIQALLKQADGKLEVHHSDPGTEFIVTFQK